MPIIWPGGPPGFLSSQTPREKRKGGKEKKNECKQSGGGNYEWGELFAEMLTYVYLSVFFSGRSGVYANHASSFGFLQCNHALCICLKNFAALRTPHSALRTPVFGSSLYAKCFLNVCHVVKVLLASCFVWCAADYK